MEIDLGPEAARFRSEIRTWISDHAPAGLAELSDWNKTLITGGHSRSDGAERSELYRAWEQELLDARLICAQWPEEFGGRGLTPVENAILSEEFHRAGLPRIRRGFGEAMVGPSVMAWGTDDQRAYFLPRIVTGEDIYCQGFSEPGHGSDLAGVETRGVVDGEEIVINGEKVWTSGYYRANMIFVLCRTDPEAPRHRGLSYVLVPMKDNNVDARPLRQMTGAAQFGQEFFDGARAPMFNVVGGVNNGWRVAMTTLGFERGGSATTSYLRFEREFWDLVDLAREAGRDTDPRVRERLGWAYSQVQVMRYQGLNLLATLAQGKEPGPEASASKLFWSEYEKSLGEFVADLRGSRGLIRPESEGYEVDPWQDIYLASRAGTIYSGTSEIQRNIIAERALGLPREGAR